MGRTRPLTLAHFKPICHRLSGRICVSNPHLNAKARVHPLRDFAPIGIVGRALRQRQAQAGAFVRGEYERWGRVIRDAGMKAE